MQQKYIYHKNDIKKTHQDICMHMPSERGPYPKEQGPYPKGQGPYPKGRGPYPILMSSP
jgi:hypothetical protein